MDLTSALRVLSRIVERGSMTAAAHDLGISQPAVSKAVRALESHVGARLLERSSRAVRPTPQGLKLYETARGALPEIDAAVEFVRGETGAITGHLRLHGPACVGEGHLHRIVMAFQDIHPAVTIDFAIENRSADLIRENFDIALRMDRPTSGDVILRRIGTSRRILVAAPEYVRRRGVVRKPQDLQRCAVIVTDASLTARGTLPLLQKDRLIEVAVTPVLTTNSAAVLLNALTAGRGIGTSQVLLVSDALREGRLVRVLPRWEVKPTELFLSYPSTRFLRPAVRAFIDFAVPALRGVEGIF